VGKRTDFAKQRKQKNSRQTKKGIWGEGTGAAVARGEGLVGGKKGEQGLSQKGKRNWATR